MNNGIQELITENLNDQLVAQVNAQVQPGEIRIFSSPWDSLSMI